MTTESPQQIRFANGALDKHCHVCAFFHSPEEEFRVLAPFLKEGFERGEKLFHIVDPKQRQGYSERLETEGLLAKEATDKGQVELRNWEHAYLRDGHFDQHRMIALIQEVLDEGRTQGFPLTRLVAHMEWALEDRPGCDDLVEYETRLNYVLPKYKDPVICTYDLSRFDAGVVIDIMRTHPMVILGGVLQENPFFVPPDVLLAELKERREVASARRRA